MTNNVTLTLDVGDALGVDFDPSRTKAFVVYNTPIVVTDDGPIRLGSGTVNVDEDGIATLTDVVASTDLVENLTATVYVDYADKRPGSSGRRVQAEFGPYDLSDYSDGDTIDVRTLEAVQHLDASFASTTQAAMQALLDEMVEISGLTGEDAAVGALVAGTGGAGPITRAALTAANDRVRSTKFFHDFTSLTNGAPLPATSDSGHGMRYVHGTSAVDFVAVNGGITATAASGSLATYLEVAGFTNPIKRIGMECSFNGGSDNGGAATLVIWCNSIADRKLAIPLNPAVPQAPIHFPLGRKSGALQYWPTDGGGSATTMATQSAAVRVADNVKVIIEVVIDGNDATVLLPDGTTKTVTNAFIGAHPGTFPCFEIFQSDAATNSDVVIHRVWASDEPDASRTQSTLPALDRALKRQPKVAKPSTASNGAITAPGTSSGNATEVDSAMRAPFVVPPSGLVLVTAHAYCNSNGTNQYFWNFKVYDSSGGVVQNPSVQVTSLAAFERRTVHLVISGLTVGIDYELRWFQWCTANSAASITVNSGTSVIPVLIVEPVA